MMRQQELRRIAHAQLEQLEVNGWRTLCVKLLNSLALNFWREKVW
jgi:hypothetical protein